MVQATLRISKETGTDPPCGERPQNLTWSDCISMNRSQEANPQKESGLARGGEETATARTASFWGDESVLKRTVVRAAQIRKCTTSHQAAHIKYRILQMGESYGI